MEQKIKEALELMIKNEWITANPHIQFDALVLTIRHKIGESSFRDIMEFFNRP